MTTDERRVPDSIVLTTDLLPKELRKHADWPACRPLVEKAMKRLAPLRATLDRDDPIHLGWEYDDNTITIAFTWDHGAAGFLIEEVGPDFVKTTCSDPNPMRLNGFIGHHWFERRTRASADMRADGYGQNDDPRDDTCPISNLLFATLERQSFRSTFSIRRADGWGSVDGGEADGDGMGPGNIWRDPRGQGWGLGDDRGLGEPGADA